MIKRIVIEFCEANQKYDSFIDDEWTGKWYDLETAMTGTIGRIERMKQLEEKKNDRT